MTTKEFLDILPQSNLTPDALNDIVFGITGIRFDVEKLRFESYGFVRALSGSVNLPANKIGIVMNCYGNGTALFESVIKVSTLNGSLRDVVFNDFSEIGGLETIGLQYAVFTWD